MIKGVKTFKSILIYINNNGYKLFFILKKKI